LERFLGIIIENYAGAFPMWLAPVQVQVIPVSDKFTKYAGQVSERLLDEGLRCETNWSDDRVSYKIRQASLAKVPYIIVVGEKEQNSGTINVRSRDDGSQVELSIEAFLEQLTLTPARAAE
jgi:threonyl-tRNA synthetase